MSTSRALLAVALVALATALAPAPASAATVLPDRATLALPHADEPAQLPATAAQRRPRALTTPGYTPPRRVPRTRAPTPPAPVSIGTGQWPDIHVDAAGTSHIVWNEDQIGETPDVTHYCRLPRGAKGCDNPNPTPMPISVPYASDDAGPKITQIGSQLVVLSHRYPSIVRHPDGQDRDRTTYAWTSSDGGTTWTGPGIVGTVIPSGDATLTGGANPRIAVITSAFTGGTLVQVLDAGNFTSKSAVLSTSTDLYEGAVAPEGDGIVAAFSEAVGPITLRRWSGAGDVTDPATWSSTQVPGELPRLAGGPAGTFLLSREGAWNVRNVTGGTAGAPTVISPRDVAQTRAFAQDPSGGLHAAFSTGASPQKITLASAGPSGFWRGYEAAAANAIDELELGAAADGGGVLVHRRDPTGTFSGEIAATAFGTLAPTGQPGAGGLAGTGIPGGFAGCLEAGFADVKLAPLAGCLLESTDPAFPGAFVSSGEVEFLGLILRPVGDTKIVFDPRKRTLNTTGRVKIILRGSAIGEIELADLKLNVQLGSNAGQSLFKGVKLPKGANIKGFPIDADFDIKIAGNGVNIPVSLKLPKALGGISASATLRAEMGRGAVLQSFAFSVGRIPLGPLEIEALNVSYDGTANRWSGTAGLKLPLGALKLSVSFVDGRFDRGEVDLRFPRPGITVFPKVYFLGVTGAFSPDPLSVSVGASFGAIYTPPPADVFAVELDGRLTLSVVNGGAQFKFDGVERIFNIQVGTGTALATTDGYASIRGEFGIDLEVVALDGSASFWVDGPSAQFAGTFDTNTRVFGIPITGAKGTLSTKGVAGCIRVPVPAPPDTFAPGYAGVGYKWGGPGELIFGDTCDMSAYQVPRPAGRAAQAGGPQSFSLAGGVKTANVLVRGESAAPLVDVIAPDGRRITPLGYKAPGGDPVVSAVPTGKATVVVLTKPPAGTWQIVPRDGSPPVTGLAISRDVDPIRVTGKVERWTSGRVLRYRVTGPAGTRVQLTERSSAGERPLKTVGRGSGVLRFSSPPGPAGLRTIVATPVGDPSPANAPKTVARYRTAATWRPAAPARATISGARVSWPGVTGAKRYLVRATLANGRTVARTTTRTSLKVPGAGRSNGVRSATVITIDRYQRTSVTRRAKVRAKR
ncbi:hypothetical protein LRS13_01485 [Svornostia abyssi]|uniref:Uncharacterized protein n=1 Tax=Svornostia abyssi TaxID=2898438 RepID=A0ABY5PHY7_9ACTN|nr:hypothetical protein LRS13_01485 [Parviterribacteraceae bacterium J379]